MSAGLANRIQDSGPLIEMVKKTKNNTLSYKAYPVSQ